MIYLLVESFITKDRHDARNDLTFYTDFPAILNPFIKDICIVEQLTDDEVSSSIDLLLEILNVIISTSRLEMHFGVTSHTDAKVVSVLFSNELYKI